ncbi:aminopeptidase P family protein [Pelagibacterales bacterium SAG-MED07]|nr:aminopeptidase P family protein [Pelagibacterales bacterium SAG-MED07]
MIKERIAKLKEKFREYDIDGYIIPKNDEFFLEYSSRDRLKTISNFSGSAGFAIILKNKNYLFVDGRYTIQAEIECGKEFKIINYEKLFNCNLFKNLTIGLDPKLFTSKQLKKIFNRYNKIKKIKLNLIDDIFDDYTSKSKPFFSLNKNVTGESHLIKIKKVANYIRKIKSNYLFVTAPENIAWLLNIRGYDSPNSPIPNCRLLITEKRKIFLIAEPNKVKKLIKEKKIQKSSLFKPNNFFYLINKLKTGKIIIDSKSCSVFYENILQKKFIILKNQDPIYHMKSVKNKIEIKNMINSHILDGVALTKFLYWIKNVNKKKINEFQAQNKLESFRKLNKNYLFPSFNTIAGAGGNGAIVHYRANRSTARKILKNDIFLCDSGGQYKYGTTDVTRTICFNQPKSYIKNIFTKVLKGHIAVASANLNKYFNGKSLDNLARRYLKKSGLDYKHGTGHGVGFFLNVHEGPQAISKYNKIKLQEGMILSNEPGFYKKGKFGIRIENLLFVKRSNNKLFFENLTLAPIEKDLINFKKLQKKEKDYLFKYHLNIYSKLSNFLNKNEKKWLASFI